VHKKKVRRLGNGEKKTAKEKGGSWTGAFLLYFFTHFLLGRLVVLTSPGAGKGLAKEGSGEEICTE